MSTTRAESASRAVHFRDSLLTLSRVLASGQPGAVLSEALEILLDGLGCARGAAYGMAGGALELIAHRGVSPVLRPMLARVEAQGAEGNRGSTGAGFVVARAARTRRIQLDADMASTSGFDRALLERSGWTSAVAAPVTLGREVLGVLLFAHPSAEPFGRDAVGFAETAANLVALALARPARADAPREAAPDPKLTELGVVGWLALGVADELREPLAALSAQLGEAEARMHVVRPSAGGASREAEVVEILLSEGRVSLARATRIRERFAGLMREDAYEPISLGELARDVVALVSPAFAARGIQLELRDRSEARVSARRGMLEQALAQLLWRIEAAAPPSSSDPLRVEITVDADSGRGRFTIEHAAVPADEPRAAGAAPTFADTISCVRRVVAQHRGSLEIGHSRSGGAHVRVALPLTTAAVKVRSSRGAPTPQPARADSQSGPGIRVLWIDDDALFLRGVKRLLRGCTVETARSAGEARQALERMPDVNRVFCDLGLPDTDGDEFHRQLVAEMPAIAHRFVFVTGGTLTPAVADYLVASGCPTLLKPVRAEELDAILQKTLANASLPPTPKLRRSRRPSAGSTPVVPKPTHPPRSASSQAPASVDLPTRGMQPKAHDPALRDREAPQTRRSAANRRKVTAPATPSVIPRENPTPVIRRRRDD